MYSVIKYDLSDSATKQIVRTPSKYVTRLASSDINFIVTYYEAAKGTQSENGESIANFVEPISKEIGFVFHTLFPSVFSNLKF
jgi:hypothetical protein